MKEGTGGDPFADDPVESSDVDESPDTGESADADESTDAPDSTDTADGADTDPSKSSPGTASTPDTTDVNAQATTDEGSSSRLPYYYRRETVKEGRDQVPFFLRDRVQDLEDDFIEDLEDRLNASNVYKADAREAALQVVYEKHVAEVADLLREWGYDR